MTLRRAAVLLLAVFVSAGALFLLPGADKRTAPPAPTAPATANSSKVIAYYFHVTVRCNTCRTIEAYSRETVLNHFKGDLDRGRLEWQVVNVQLAENKHFVQDYQLFTKSVVLVHVVNGKPQSHKILNDVWELVGDKAKFQGYVDKEVRAYLAKLG